MNEIFDLLKLEDKELHLLFREIVSTATQETPSEFISYCWSEYEKKEVVSLLILQKTEMDNRLIQELKQYTFLEAGSVAIVVGNLVNKSQ